MAGIYDAYKSVLGDRDWNQTNNSFIDAVGATMGGLNALVSAWAVADQMLVLVPQEPTYVGTTSFTMPGDQTEFFPVGTKVQALLASGVIKWSTVFSYDSGTGTVVLDDAILTDPITAIYVTLERDGAIPYGPGYVVARTFGVPGRTAIVDALAAIGILERTLVLSPGTWEIDDDLEIPANVLLYPERGAVLDILTTKTLNPRGGFRAGRYQCITLNGTGAVSFTDTVPDVFPEWFGGFPDGSTDCADAFIAAHDSLPSTGGGIIDCDGGTYAITPNEVVITKDRVIIQGKGAVADDVGAYYAGSVLQAKTGTGEIIAFTGAAYDSILMGCGMNDLVLLGDEETVQGFSLKWAAKFNSRNVKVIFCYDHGVYLEQAWDCKFYNLHIRYSGNQAADKAGLYIYNGADDCSNNLWFYGFHAESNYGNDVVGDASGAGLDNYHLAWIGGKIEKSPGLMNPSVKAFHFFGWDGADGQANNFVTIKNVGLYNFQEAGDIGIHFEGAGYMLVDNCYFLNGVDEGTGIKIEGPVFGTFTHRLTNNHFSQVAQEITIESTCPRDRVRTENNTSGIYSDTDARVHINSDLVKDARRLVLLREGADHASSGTGEDDLASVTVPAGLLSTCGGIKVHASGWMDGAAGNKTINFYFGASTVEVFPAGSLSVPWLLEAEFYNAGGASGQVGWWRFTVQGAPSTVSGGIISWSEDTTIDVTLKLTGECADGGDVIHQSTMDVVEL